MNQIIPGIKTDSIYKFMAVFGLVLFLSPSVIVDKRLELKLQINEYYKTVELNKEKREKIDEMILKKNKEKENYNKTISNKNLQINELQKEIDSIYEEYLELQKKGTLTIEKDRYSSLITKYAKKIDELKQIKNNIYDEDYNRLIMLYDEIEAKMDEYSILLIDREYLLNEIEIKDNYINQKNVFEIFLRVLGFLLSIVGFILWYVRIQIYVDKEIKEK